jgi:Ca2+-transporting ATPase
VTVVEVLDAVDRYTVSGIGYGLEGQVQHAAGTSLSIDDAILPYVIASDAKLEDGKVVGDPTEGALLVLGHKAGLDIDASRERYPRLATLPFDPVYKLMATFNSTTDSTGKSVVRCFVKGAAPAVFGRTTSALAGGESMPLDDALKKKADDAVARMAGEGHRVMAAAVRDLDPAAFDPQGDLLGYVTGLQLASVVGMVDPPREESKAAVRDAQAAHIRVRMVTGDDVSTGAAIAQQLGIPGEAMLGTDFAAMSEPERLRRIDGIGVVGRVAPEHKVLLVETLRKKGDVVAMTGDGVNDAPAIKAADIGIAMGSGTEVAKNAGRMILSDDNFATIVKAVEKGRAVYDNLNKYIRFVMLELVAYIITFLGASILNIAAGQPFSAPQILYINFLVNAPLGIALGMDKESPGLMARSPRPRDATIMTRGLLTTAGLVGLFMAVTTLALISYGTTHYGSAAIGSSIGLTAFSLLIVASAFQARSVTATALTNETFDNRHLNWTVLAEIVLAVLITQMDVMRRIFGTEQLTGEQWLLALAPAVALFFLWELGKLIARHGAEPAREAAAPAEEPAA